MLYREMIAVCVWEPYKTQKYTVWEEVRILDVKIRGEYIRYCVLNGYK